MIVESTYENRLKDVRYWKWNKQSNVSWLGLILGSWNWLSSSWKCIEIKKLWNYLGIEAIEVEVESRWVISVVIIKKKW